MNAGADEPDNRSARRAARKLPEGRAIEDGVPGVQHAARFRWRRAGPAIVVSGLLHLALVLLFAAWTLRPVAPLVEPISSRWRNRPLAEAAPATIEPLRIRPQDVRLAGPSAPAESNSGRGVAPPLVRPVDVSSALAGRHPAQIAAAAGDGSPREKAINAALRWIARQQQPDGRWRLSSGYPDAGDIETDAGATALALLALVGAGNTPVDGPHALVVRRGLDWLVGQQQPDGNLFDRREEGLEAHFYSHAMATIALCEALALSQEAALRPPAERAVSYLVESQNPVAGGWKYRPLTRTGVGDLSVTGWALMALHSARMAEIPVDDKAFLLASRFLDSVQRSPSQPAFYRYRPDEPSDRSQAWSMTAEGLLCREWLGWPADLPALQEGAEFLATNDIAWDDGNRNVYAWYYTGQVLHHLGGARWTEWFEQTSDLLVAHQDVAGRTAGSWNPVHPPGAFLEWSRGAGRLYFTVLCTLVLETPDRHQPLYGAPAPAAP